MTVRGIDYHWAKGSPSLDGLDFVWLKGWQGVDYSEHSDWLDGQVARARKAGLVVGVYGFMDDVVSGEYLADKVLEVGADADMLGIDWEWCGWGCVAQSNETDAAAALNRLRAKSDKPAVLYTSDNFLGPYRPLGGDVTKSHLWYVLAHGYPPEFSTWKFRQTGSVGGIDQDEFNGTRSDLDSFIGGDMTHDDVVNIVKDLLGITDEDKIKDVGDVGMALRAKVLGEGAPTSRIRPQAFDYLTSCEGGAGPEGPQGPPGEKGDKGDKGDSAVVATGSTLKVVEESP